MADQTITGAAGLPSYLRFGVGSLAATYTIEGSAGLDLGAIGSGVLICVYGIIGARGLPSGQRFGSGGIVYGSNVAVADIAEPWWVDESVVMFQPQDNPPPLSSRTHVPRRVYLGSDWAAIEPWRMPRVGPDESDTIVTVLAGEEGRLDILSWRIYKTPVLWWVLALVNNIQNPFEEPVAGDRIRVPSLQRIYHNILGQQATGEELYVERSSEV